MALKISDLEAFSSVTVGANGVTSKFQTMGSNTGGLAEVYVTAGGGDAFRLNTNFVNGNYIDINPYITGVSNGGLEIKQNGTPRFVISAGGNISVGTTTDVGAKFYVAGGIRASEALISGGLLEFTGGWSASPYANSSWIRGANGTGMFLVNNAITKWAGFKPNSDFDINGGALSVLSSNANVGIGTSDPVAGLDNQSTPGTYRQNGFTTLVTNTLAAIGTQARRFEIARMSIDYNDWNSVGPVEVELYEKYFSQGLKKKYSIYYGYVSSSGCNLTEMTGYGENRFRVVLGPEVVVSGDIRYISIFVEVNYYSQVTAVLKTNRELQASNPPGAGGIWVNKNPSGTNIADFNDTGAVYVGNIIGGDSLFTTGKVGIGTSSPATKLSVVGGNGEVARLESSPFDAASGNGPALTFQLTQSNGQSAQLGLIKGSADTSWGGILTFNTKENNGTPNNTTVERMRIFSSGNIFIGSTPTDAGYKLDVNGNSVFRDNVRIQAPSTILQLHCTTGTAQNWWVGQDTSGFGDGIFYIFNATAGVQSLNINKSNNATFAGTVTATGFFNSSDIRLKEIVDYDYNISDIKPISYLWKDSRDNKKHVGYSAQEVQKVMPDAVNEGEDGMLSVNYIEVLVAKIAELENRIKQLEK